jgi:hypothetical protein
MFTDPTANKQQPQRSPSPQSDIDMSSGEESSSKNVVLKTNMSYFDERKTLTLMHGPSQNDQSLLKKRLRTEVDNNLVSQKGGSGDQGYIKTCDSQPSLTSQNVSLTNNFSMIMGSMDNSLVSDAALQRTRDNFVDVSFKYHTEMTAGHLYFE